MMLSISVTVAAEVPSAGKSCSMMARTARIAPDILRAFHSVDGSYLKRLHRGNERVVDGARDRLAGTDRSLDLGPGGRAGIDAPNDGAAIGGRANRLREFLRNAVVGVIGRRHLQGIEGIRDN